MSCLCGMGEEMLGIHWTLAQPSCISRRWLNDEELKVSFYPRKCCTDGGMCVRPSPLQAKALTPGRSSDPEDLVHSPCACCLSRSAHVWNCASAPERWDGVFCENIFLLVLQGKEETPCPAYHLEAIGTKGRLLFLFSSVIQKLLAPWSRLHCPVKRCQMTAEWSANLIMSRRRCRCYCCRWCRADDYYFGAFFYPWTNFAGVRRPAQSHLAWELLARSLRLLLCISLSRVIIRTFPKKALFLSSLKT